MDNNISGKRPSGVWIGKSSPARVYKVRESAISQCTHQGNVAFPVFGISKNPTEKKIHEKATW